QSWTNQTSRHAEKRASLKRSRNKTLTQSPPRFRGSGGTISTRLGEPATGSQISYSDDASNTGFATAFTRTGRTLARRASNSMIEEPAELFDSMTLHVTEITHPASTHRKHRVA